MRLHWERHGNGPGTPVLMIMGLGADLHGWERQVPALAVDRPVIVFDNRGVGRSDKPLGPYTTAELADDAVSVMNLAGVRVAHVIGMSLGGMIAQQVAIRHAPRVRSLALLSTYARGDAGTRATAEQGAAAARFDLGAVMRAMDAAPEGGATLDARTLMAFLMPLVFSAEFLATQRAWLKQFYERSLSYGFSPVGFAGQVAAVMSHDATNELARLAMPTLVVTGTRDRLVPSRHSTTLAAAIPGARLVELEGGTHGINFERADELNALLNDWLREVEA